MVVVVLGGGGRAGVVWIDNRMFKLWMVCIGLC